MQDSQLQLYLDILKKSNVEITPELFDGQLEDIHVLRQSMIATVTLHFPNVLSIQNLLIVEKAVEKYFLEEGFKGAKLVVHYDNPAISNEALSDYFNYTINSLEDSQHRYAIVNEMNKTFEKNKVSIFVANDDEVEVLSNIIEGINSFFKVLGIKAEVEAVASSFETPILNIIEENKRRANIDALRQQTIYDSSSNEANDDYDTKKKKYIKPPKQKAAINRPATPLATLPSSQADLVEYNQKNGNQEIAIEGTILKSEVIERNSKTDDRRFMIYQATLVEGDHAIVIKTFINLKIEGNEQYYKEKAVAGVRIKCSGYLTYDQYVRDVVFNITDLMIVNDGKEELVKPVDLAPVKRVELHAHSKMSVQDSVMDIADYVSMAADYGHRAVALTDMHNIHAFPDLYEQCTKAGILPIFGLEGELVDEDKYKIALNESDKTVNLDLRDATYVVYDLETTGFSSNYNEIIEVAAAKVKNGQIVDEFSTFVKPMREIGRQITELTSITNDDVRTAPSVEEVLPAFYNFFKGCILVAHNATFDNSHLFQGLARLGIDASDTPSIDTLQLAKVRYGHGTRLKKFNLKALCQYFDVELLQHHRAINDAKATAYCFIKMLSDLFEAHIDFYDEINKCIDLEAAFELAYPTHFTILSKNEKGRKNLYEIVSDSHTTHFHKKPMVLKSFLEAHREGLLIGSGCIEGEVFDTAYNKSYEELLKVMEFYDYIEIQPVSICSVLVHRYQDKAVYGFIEDTIKKIIKAAKELGKLVVATGNVHHLRKEDLLLRKIYIDAPQIGGGVHPLKDIIDNVPSMHFMNTEEMLNEFKFLGDDLAYEVVVTNTNKIADMISSYSLFPQDLFTPKDDMLKDNGVPSFEGGVREMTYTNAKKIYGDPLPKFIEDRIEKELSVILGKGYASIYYISHLLVKYSTDAGYVVGSRGSVGSSIVATFMNITEVNGLPPHYYCPHCHFVAIKYSDEEKKIYERSAEQLMFEKALQEVDTGFDLEEAVCPICGKPLKRNGVDIPFETFLGSKTDVKVPDIDLNFSGEFQAKAHEFCRTMFGKDHAFRAGTILTIADKTAYGYVRNFFERQGQVARQAEITLLADKISGVKRSTSQHPGGIVVLPKEIEFTDIIPVQYPADDMTSTWRTTHFDYHKFEKNLLKLDILGHDDPTMIKFLMDCVHAHPKEFDFSTVEDIPILDPAVFRLFNSVDSLGLTPGDVDGEDIGTTGIPEFGTKLAKDMLREAAPKTYADLLKISGLSHGTDVWNGNARDFLHGKKEGFPAIPFKELIGCRDDIMVYLVSKNVPSSDAFKIMEKVRKGKGVSTDYEREMLSYGVPKWYIESCKLIKYMFPKAHATAYVIMALRIGWFKVYKPLYYYSAFFSRRAKAFDIEAMAGGKERIALAIRDLQNKVQMKTATNKDQDVLNCLQLALEASARGVKFKQIDINSSAAYDFLVSSEDNSLLIPFSALDTLGGATAESIVAERERRPFASKRDVLNRTKINSSQLDKLSELGSLGDLPDDEDNSFGLF